MKKLLTLAALFLMLASIGLVLLDFYLGAFSCVVGSVLLAGLLLTGRQKFIGD